MLSVQELIFITGSLVIDIMSANGDQEPPIPQRVFWALVEGATATALLVAGGKESLSALQVIYHFEKLLFKFRYFYVYISISIKNITTSR